MISGGQFLNVRKYEWGVMWSDMEVSSMYGQVTSIYQREMDGSEKCSPSQMVIRSVGVESVMQRGTPPGLEFIKRSIVGQGCTVQL